jgi:hypothetical protein
MFAGLVAVLAMSVVAVGSASAALPEFLNAKKEAVKSPVTFTGESSGTAISFQSGGEFACTHWSISGELINSKEVRHTVVKWECGGLPFVCGQHETNKWTSEALKGTIGYINKEHKEVGLELQAEAETEVEKVKIPGPWFSKITCALETFNIDGELIGGLTTVNKLSTSFSLKEEGVSGVQHVTKFEGGPSEQHLYRPPATGFAVNSSFALAFSQSLELHA